MNNNFNNNNIPPHQPNVRGIPPYQSRQSESENDSINKNAQYPQRGYNGTNPTQSFTGHNSPINSGNPVNTAYNNPNNAYQNNQNQGANSFPTSSDDAVNLNRSNSPIKNTSSTASTNGSAHTNNVEKVNALNSESANKAAAQPIDRANTANQQLAGEAAGTQNSTAQRSRSTHNHSNAMLTEPNRASNGIIIAIFIGLMLLLAVGIIGYAVTASEQIESCTNLSQEYFSDGYNNYSYDYDY